MDISVNRDEHKQHQVPIQPFNQLIQSVLNMNETTLGGG